MTWSKCDIAVDQTLWQNLLVTMVTPIKLLWINTLLPRIHFGVRPMQLSSSVPCCSFMGPKFRKEVQTPMQFLDILPSEQPALMTLSFLEILFDHWVASCKCRDSRYSQSLQSSQPTIRQTNLDMTSFDACFCCLTFCIVTRLPTEVAGVNCKRLLIHFHGHAIHCHSSIPRKEKTTQVDKVTLLKTPKMTMLDQAMYSIENIEILMFFLPISELVKLVSTPHGHSQANSQLRS